MPDPTTGQFSMVQMTDENVPTPEEARLAASWYDATNGCFEPMTAAFQSARPDLAVILNNMRAAQSQAFDGASG
jgi:hypothetical protein